jgi:probable rRNA maturation factor
MIHYHNEDHSYKISDKLKIRNWVKKIVELENKTLGTINYIFVSDEYLLKLNNESLNHDYYTDIITFDYTEKSIISGDLFISIDRVIDNAKQLNVLFIDELHRVMIHGVLHLCGYGDKSTKEEKIMRSKEDFSLTLRDF